MRYLQSRAIFTLFIEKSSAEQRVDNYSNIFIRAVKAINAGVIRVEVLERWQRLKIYRMLLVKYFRKGKIKLLCRKIKSFTSIQLKTVPRLLISESRLEERLESSIRRRSAIVIIVSTSKKTAKLYSKGLRFREALKIVEKY